MSLFKVDPIKRTTCFGIPGLLYALLNDVAAQVMEVNTVDYRCLVFMPTHVFCMHQGYSSPWYILIQIIVQSHVMQYMSKTS